MYQPTKSKTRSANDLLNGAYAMFCVFFLLIFFVKTYVVGTHLNCINKSMQFKWVPTTYAFIKKQTKSTLAVIDAIQMTTHNICLYKEVDKKYTGCNLKTTELLDCALIGVCVVIRSNTVSP